MPLSKRRSSTSSSSAPTPSGSARVPPPTKHRCHQQLQLVDEPCRDRLSGQLGPADADVPLGLVLESLHRLGFEAPAPASSARSTPTPTSAE